MRISDWSSTCALPIYRRTASPAAALVGERQRRAAVPGEFRDLLYRDDDVPALRSAEPGPHIPSPLMGRQRDLRIYSLGGVGLPLEESRPVLKQIGRASCRARVCPHVSISVVPDLLK